MKKRFICTLLSLMITASMITGCSSAKVADASAPSSYNEEATSEAPKKEIIPFFRTGCKTEATACAAFTLENRSGCSHCIFTRNPLYLFLEKKAA